MCAQIIGVVPDGGQYLIGSDDFPTGEIPPEKAAARILDTEREILFKPQAFHSITARLPRLTEYEGEMTVNDVIDGVDIQGPSVAETPTKLDTVRLQTAD
jgi:hypothetical protein